MNLLVVPLAKVESSIALLSELPGVSVHQRDPVTGRIIVTQEAESVGAELEGLDRIKAIPNVILAEMVYHYFEDDRIEGGGPLDPGE
jgi:nitrate reductase NapD